MNFSTFWTQILVHSSRDSCDRKAMCGVSTTFSNLISGLSNGSGYLSKTSRSAPPICFSLRAFMRATSSTIFPLAAFIRKAVVQGLEL